MKNDLNKTRVHLATDHAGFELKEKIEQWLIDRGYAIVDHGAFEYDENDDYPDFIIPAAHAVAQNPEDRAIILGGSGQGEAMVANRLPGVRAVVWYGGSLDIIELSRQHNNANVLSLGARFVTEYEALEAIELWLSTEFSEENRHIRRMNKFD
ncbi:RpiB/LacA/LacB family sugar-phosphate isomerase [Candidatus Nomurabacteria bacterium]|nr:RpiB/LacA/LacB family sugar-phosphate isomerase [Candidatus Nomurabacteria bacterium]